MEIPKKDVNLQSPGAKVVSPSFPFTPFHFVFVIRFAFFSSTTVICGPPVPLAGGARRVNQSVAVAERRIR
jgi:hypothetical protein